MRRNPILTPCLPALLLSVWLSAAASAQTPVLESQLVQSGFSQPLYVASPPGDTHRLFVVEHAGVIKIIKDGATLPTPFMNINPIVGGGQQASDERGLLGLAFHPDYSANRRFYVSYTNLNGDSVLREYLADANDPDLADTSTWTTILPRIDQPQTNHNGGCIQFGPDGKLYMSLGDGGNANDVGDGHDPLIGNGQSLETYLGKLLRIDVENPPTYVPAGNPFSASAYPLIWAYGLRNTWRFSFDRQTGDMYLADVGQNAVEEIDFQPAASTGGENYGWRCMEGTSCTGFAGCICNDAALKLPIQEYTHSSGCSVTGGYVYRGTAVTGFQGHYIYGDYCNGKFWSFRYDGSTVQDFTDRTAELDPAGGLFINNPTSFGEDANGELYICDFGGGEIYRIQGKCPDPANYCVAAPNSTGFGATMTFAGSGNISLNDLQLYTTNCPADKNGYYIYGPTMVQVPLGNGFRCVGGTIQRLPLIHTSSFGDAQWDFDVTAPPAVITPGSTWNFQFYYRDPSVGAHFNLSDGLAVLFCAG